MMRRVVFQMDYVMNAQFGGLVVAANRGLYRSANLNVELKEAWTNVARWSSKGAGQEPFLVAAAAKAAAGNSTSFLGCVELNVLMEAQSRGAAVRAVAPMMRGSALALGMRPGVEASSLSALRGQRIGMHADSMDLVAALGKKHPELGLEVVLVNAADKYRRLVDGDVDAIQIYDVTEPLELDRLCGAPATVLPLASHIYGCEGYSQVVFAANDGAEDDAVRSFVEATREGWRLAFEDPQRAAREVVAARSESGTYSKSGEQDGVEMQAQIIERLKPYVASEPGLAQESWNTAAAQLKLLGVLGETDCSASTALHPVATSL